MSLSLEKISDNDIALAINLDDGGIIYYHEDDYDPSENVEFNLDDLTDREIEDLNEIWDDYPSIKFRLAHIDDYLKAKKDAMKKMKEDLKVKKITDGNFFPLPLSIKKDDEQVDTFHVNGKNSSGKSYWIAEYVKLYMDKYPNNDIFLFSRKKKDKVFDEIEGLIRVPMDEDFLEANIDIDALENSLVIFDDVERLPKEYKKKVFEMRDSLLQLGRDRHNFIMNATHTVKNYAATKTINEETSGFTIFPKKNINQSKKILKDFIGLNKNQIKDVMELNSRWVFIRMDVPLCVISQNKVELI